MGFSSGYWHYFHYSDSRSYLIFCCHSVAIRAAANFHVRVIIQYKELLSKFITAVILNIFYYSLQVSVDCLFFCFAHSLASFTCLGSL